MIDLSNRSLQKELLDNDNIPFAEIVTVMEELNSINTFLGGHAITISGVRKLAGSSNDLHICEIGCGGGDNLFAIQKALSKSNCRLRFTGIDIKKECIDFAAQRYPQLPANWLCSDYQKVDLSADKPHIIFSSLFTHHFTYPELVTMLQWQKINSRLGFFSNDLERNRLAWYLIKWLTAAFSKSKLVKNDACLSVARSFRKADWLRLFAAAGLAAPEIRRRWAFRYLTMYRDAR